MDECHHASSNSYYKLGSLMPNTEYRCGFSGTAYRDDGNELMMFATLGRIAYSLTGQQLINDGYLMRPEIYFIKYNVDDITQKELEFNASNGLMNEEPNYALHYNSFIVNNKKRNDIIKEICDKHSGDTILILVKLIDHGKILESLIPNSKYVYGKTKKQIRTDMLTEFKSGNHKILISTISIFSEGVDIPNLDVIINASANKGDVKSVQVLGRVLRKNDNKVHAYYYDFYDNDSFLKNASISRQKIFRNNGHEVLFK
jgi:superfamily II DNA or RNA helicase